MSKRNEVIDLYQKLAKAFIFEMEKYDFKPETFPYPIFFAFTVILQASLNMASKEIKNELISHFIDSMKHQINVLEANRRE